MKRKAVFPGSFDPFTRGHDDIVKRGLRFFDEVIIAIGSNSTKQYLIPLDTRIKLIQQLYNNNSRIQVISYEGLTVEFIRKQGASVILRGLRNGIDFEYEKSIALMNREMDENADTVFVLSSPLYAHIQSSVVREIYKNGGDISSFIPEGMKW